MLFKYEVIKGRRSIKGIAEAISEKEITGKLSRLYGTMAKIKIRKHRFWERKRSVKTAVKMLFYRQMEAMLRCGIPLPDGLRLSASSCPDAHFSLRILDIEAEVLQGRYMYQAMDKVENFTTVEKALISAGEESASLDIIFRRLYEYFKNVYKVKSKVTESLVYPLSIVLVMIAVLILVSRMVVPKFVEIYQSMGVELPYFTSLMLMMLEKITTIAPILIICGLIAIGFFKQLIKKEKYKLKWDRFILNMPQIGEILLASYWTQILRALEILVAAGVDLYKSLQHAKEVATRIPLKEVLEHASKAVLSGRMIHSSLQRNLEYVPAIAIGMIAAGENTGSLENMLATTAEYLEDELNHRIELFMKILEPALIVAVGIIVGVVVLALYLPIFTLASKM